MEFLGFLLAFVGFFGFIIFLIVFIIMAILKKQKAPFAITMGCCFISLILGLFFYGKANPQIEEITPKNKDIQNTQENIESNKKGESASDTILYENDTSSGIIGVEVTNDNGENEIEDFSYELSGNKIILKSFLKSYNKNTRMLEIKSSYIIDGITYQTDLSEFSIQSGIDTLILDEGIKEIKTSIFNSSNIKNVFFPKSITNIYDYTLAYMHPDDNETIKIYYAGTQEEWSQIFTEYKRTPVGETEFGGEMGTAIADWVNEKIGVSYDSSKFEYFFSADPSVLK